MALIQSARNSAGGSGQTLAWARDRTERTTAFSSGLILTLSQTPIDEDGILVLSEGLPLDTDDFNYIAPNQIEILFAANPATDTDDGEWIFTVQYPYST